MSEPPPLTTDLADAQERVKLPAVFLIIAGCLNVCASLILIGVGVSYVRMDDEELRRHVRDSWRKYPPELKEFLVRHDIDEAELVERTRSTGPFSLGWGIASTLLGLLSVLAGFRMLRLRSFGLTVLGAGVMAIPCVSPLGCCLMGEVVGIWALFVLLSPGIRSAFQTGTFVRGTPP